MKFVLQVTKLCDLGMDDSVCSVGWAQRGTHLAVGTSKGKIQVWDCLFYIYINVGNNRFGFRFGSLSLSIRQEFVNPNRCNL